MERDRLYGCLSWVVAVLFLVTSLDARVLGNDESGEGALVAGKAALEDGFYEMAQKQFETYLEGVEKKEDRVTGTLLLVQALLGLGELDKAEDLLQTLRPWVSGRPDEPAFMYWLARVQYERHDVMAALTTLNDLVHRYPKDSLAARSQTLAAHCHLRQGEPEKALILFESIARQFPEGAHVADNLLNWAGLLIQQARLDEAERCLKELQALQLTGSQVDQALLWNSHLAVSQQAWAEAKDTLQQLLEKDNVRADLHYDAAMLLARVEESDADYAAALAAVQLALDRLPKKESRTEVNLEKGRLMIRVGDTKGGLRLLRSTIVSMDSDEEAGAAQLRFAQSLHEQGLYSQAVNEYQTYLEAFSESGDPSLALEGKGWSLWELGRFAEAATAFDKASLAAPGEARKAQNLLKASDAYFATDQFQKAYDSYDQFVSGFASHELAGQAKYQMALCLAHKDSVEKANEQLRELWNDTSDPDLAVRSGLLLATLAEEQRRWEDAIQVYDDVIQRYPDAQHFEEVLLRKALARYRLGMFEEALEDFESLGSRALDSDVVEQAFYMRVYSHYMLGDGEEAVQLAQTFLQLHPTSRWAPEVLLWLGEYYFNQREYALAETTYERLSVDFTDTPHVAEVGLLEAARCAFYQEEYTRANDHVNELAKNYPASKRMPEARFIQGDALSEKGEFGAAILTMEEITTKWPVSYLVGPAHGRIGDFHFTLGSGDESRYEEALKHFQMVIDAKNIHPDLALQALYKSGRCQEKMGNEDVAFDMYSEVMYQTLAYWSEGTSVGTVWFSRAAFAGGALKEKREEWREAVRIYSRVADSGGPARDDAEQRIQKIRREHFVAF